MAVAAPSQKLDRREDERLGPEGLTHKLRGEGPPPAREQHGVAASRAGGPPHPLVVNVSARHMHVTQADLETLFGQGSKLTKLKDLYQQGEFASEQLVT